MGKERDNYIDLMNTKELCALCNIPLEEDDDIDFDGYRYIGGSHYMYCPQAQYDEANEEAHTFRRFG